MGNVEREWREEEGKMKGGERYEGRTERTGSAGRE